VRVVPRDALPCPIREIENVFIPMPDGCRLAARIWLPEDAEQHPVPAILEYIPYRKRDFMRVRDEPMHSYLAGHGYASVRVDLRGSGDSDGVLVDEYLPQEQDDAVAVIEWLAEQPWCTGRVGMTGISWGGFNALQVAARAPAALAAVVTLCSTDDRYADDAHYMGGCLLNENQIWGTVLFALNALPPDPEIVGDGWREQWLERLEQNRPFPAVWLRHPHRDDYWEQGSICENYAAIRAPVYAIGGWADGYSNAVFRLLEGLAVPKKGLIGPWAHNFPHNGSPGPAIGYLQEALRWWDHWLKDRPTGIMNEPLLRAWMQYSEAPEPVRAARNGRWVGEAEWPSPSIDPRTWYLAASGTLTATPGELVDVEICSPQTTGSSGGDWCGFGADGEAALDQRPDDGRSLCFTSDPLADPLEILGAPLVLLDVSANEPVAHLVVRLSEILPDGTSALVTYGVLNLTHRNSHRDPEPLEPGRRYRVQVRLNEVAHRFAEGHALRVGISTCYWPMIWPAPRPVTLSVLAGSASLTLPGRSPLPLDGLLPDFPQPESAEISTGWTPLEPPRMIRRFERDRITHNAVYRVFSEGGDLEAGSVMRLDDIALDLGHTVERRFTIGETDPGTARAEVSERYLMRREGWQVRVRASVTLTCDEHSFRVRATLAADEDEPPRQVFVREWDETLPRSLL
jgi:putative CocE/NonD family hydrolase